MSRLPALLAAFFALLLPVGCRAFPGHPVRLSLPSPAAGAAAPAAPAVEEPPAPAPEAVPLFLFLGLEGVLERLAALRTLPLPTGREPRLVPLPDVEARVRRRYARGGFGGPVRSVVVLGVCGRVPLSPPAMADLMLDPEVERQVLAATTFRRLAREYVLPGAHRERCRVEMLRVGAGPFRYDLRFTSAVERRDAADGRIWMRYDPGVLPQGEHVTLYRGGCLLEPHGEGTRVTELLILGTDLRMLPPFQGQLEAMARQTLVNRATNLWVRAWR